MYVLRVTFEHGQLTPCIRTDDFMCESSEVLESHIRYWKQGTAYIKHEVLEINTQYLPNTLSGLSDVVSPSF